MNKRFISLLLAILMMLMMLPINKVQAENVDTDVSPAVKSASIELYNHLLNSKASNPYTFDYNMYFAKYALSQEVLKHNGISTLEFYNNPQIDFLNLYMYVFDKSDDWLNFPEEYNVYRDIVESIKSGEIGESDEELGIKVAKSEEDVSSFINSWIETYKKEGDLHGDFYFIVIKGIEDAVLTPRKFFMSEKDYEKYMPIIRNAILNACDLNYVKSNIRQTYKKFTVEKYVPELSDRGSISLSMFDFGEKIPDYYNNEYITPSLINFLKDNDRRTIIVNKPMVGIYMSPLFEDDEFVNYYLKDISYKPSPNLAFKEVKNIGTVNRIAPSFDVEKDENKNPDLISKNKSGIVVLRNMFDDSFSVGLEDLGYVEVGNVDKQTEELPYKTIEKEDSSLQKGATKVEVEGKNGSKTTITTYQVNEKTGELENPVVTYENVEPIDKVILVGTKEKTYSIVKPEKTSVVAVDSLTPDEKTAVEKAVKKSNPDATNIEVKDNGDVIVTFPDGTILDLKQEDTVIQKDSEDTKKDNEKYPAVKPNKTKVVNKDALTSEEKGKVAEEVKKTNPKAKDIEVKNNGDTVITYPDGSTNELKQVDTVVQKKVEDKRKDNEKYPAQKPIRTAVEDKSDLTYREKERVTERIKDANPHALAVSVKDNGDATLIYADGSTNELKQRDTVYELGESRKPDVDKIYEGDKYITGKGEPYASIDIKLPNGKIVSGSTDRYGYFKIKVPAKVELKEDDILYATQTEFESEESDRVKVTVLKNDKVDKKLKTEQHYAYIVGYPDGRFGPNDIITRAQTAMIFARLSRNQNAAPASYFSDINSRDWYAKAVGIGIQEGFIKGYVDGTFKPNQPMTRAEFASVISAFAEKETKRSNYKDVDGWAAGVIDTAYVNGWMKGGGRGYFRPNDYITRAEAVSVVNRMLKRNPDKEFIDKHVLTSSTLLARPFTDVDMNSWYFYDVYAAAFGHDYKIKDKVEKWTELNGEVFTVR